MFLVLTCANLTATLPWCRGWLSGHRCFSKGVPSDFQHIYIRLLWCWGWLLGCRERVAYWPTGSQKKECELFWIRLVTLFILWHFFLRKEEHTFSQHNTFKRNISPKNENVVIIYSPSRYSKPV